MFRRTPLLSIVLSNLAALVSALGPQYTLINQCSIPITVHKSTGGPSNILSPSGGNVAGNLGANSGFLYTDVNGGTSTMKAGFHGDGDRFYYYVVKDVKNFQTGISITPSPDPDGPFCNAARCDRVSCPFAFSTSPPPPSFPKFVDGVAPNPPLYSCPVAGLTYTITFCPSGLPPQLPFYIQPNLRAGKCLEVRNAIYADNTAVQIADCSPGKKSQEWFINPGTTQVRAASPNRDFCLDAGSNPSSGIPMKIWKCYDNLAAQKWYRSLSHNTIALVGKGQCLDVTDGKTGNGQQMQTWECTPGNANQVWNVIPV